MKRYSERTWTPFSPPPSSWTKLRRSLLNAGHRMAILNNIHQHSPHQPELSKTFRLSICLVCLIIIIWLEKLYCRMFRPKLGLSPCRRSKQRGRKSYQEKNTHNHLYSVKAKSLIFFCTKPQAGFKPGSEQVSYGNPMIGRCDGTSHKKC